MKKQNPFSFINVTRDHFQILDGTVLLLLFTLVVPAIRFVQFKKTHAHDTANVFFLIDNMLAATLTNC